MSDLMLAQSKPKETNLVEKFVEPLARLRGEIDRVFDDFPVRFPAITLPSGLAALLPTPAVEMTETDKAYKVNVEVPGIAADKIEVEAEKGLLVIKGEKREEREEKERDFTRSERSYGAFERRIALPADAELDKIEAKAGDGVLKIRIPRGEQAAPARRKIAIKSAKQSDCRSPAGEPVPLGRASGNIGRDGASTRSATGPFRFPPRNGPFASTGPVRQERPPMKISHATLVMAIDGRKMLLFRNQGDEKYIVLDTLENEEVKTPPSHQLGSDAPGRTFSSTSPRRSGYGETDWHSQAEARFAILGASALEHAASGNQADIVVVAPPRVLGELRKHWGRETRKRLVAEIGKDLVHHETDDIARAVTAHLSPRARG
jgi:HSP20 family protein